MIKDAINRWNRRRLEKRRLKKSGIEIVAINTANLSKALGSHVDPLRDLRIVVATRFTHTYSSNNVEAAQHPGCLRSILAALDELPAEVATTLLIATDQPISGSDTYEIIKTNSPHDELTDLRTLLAAAKTRSATHLILVDEDSIVEPSAFVNLLRTSASANHQALVEALHFPDGQPKFYDPNSLATDQVSRMCLLIPEKGLNAIKDIDIYVDKATTDLELSRLAQSAGLHLMSCPTALVCASCIPSTSGILHTSDVHTLSIIIRFHDISRLSELKRCLFSIACSTYSNKEAVVVCQSFSMTELDLVKDYAAKLNKFSHTHIRIISPSLPKGIDHRSTLLNKGIAEANGKYLAFLDYDDCIYPYAYSRLIDAICASQSVIAFGDITMTKATIVGSATIVRNKMRPWGERNLFDLLNNSCCPIHSFVIDRTNIPKVDFIFDEALSKYEDYDFLIKVCSQYRSDFSLIGEVVGDYYIKDDGSNSVVTPSSFSANAQDAWRASKELVFSRRDRTPLGHDAADQINRLLSDLNMIGLPRGACVRDVNLVSAQLRKLT